jgi:integrase
MGYLYRRGAIWWIRYSYNGRRIRESSRSTLKTVAEAFLKRREGDLAHGREPAQYERTSFEELAAAYLGDYEIRERRSLGKAERIVRLYLRPFFGTYRAVAIDTDLIRSYTLRRLQDGAANATVNRELAALKRMFRLALQNTPPKVERVPYVPMLTESNVRQGFFEHADFLTFRSALPPHLRPLVTFGYKLGCRRGELTGLRWSAVNFREGSIRLSGRETKTGRPRTIHLDEELVSMLRASRLATPAGCEHVFHNRGRAIRDFRAAWDRACKTIGRAGYRSPREERERKLTFHDLRRTAIRNMIRAGVSQTVAMSRSGHRTAAVFARYDIVSDEDDRAAALRLESHLKGLDPGVGKSPQGHKKGHIARLRRPAKSA